MHNLDYQSINLIKASSYATTVLVERERILCYAQYDSRSTHSGELLLRPPPNAHEAHCEYLRQRVDVFVDNLAVETHKFRILPQPCYVERYPPQPGPGTSSSASAATAAST